MGCRHVACHTAPTPCAHRNDTTSPPPPPPPNLGVDVAGSSEGIFESLFALKKKQEETTRHFRDRTGVGAFYRTPGYVSPTASLDAIARSFVETYVLGATGSAFRASEEKARLVGYKEIRFKSAAELDYLIHLFPCAKIIVNVRRDVVKQSESDTWVKGAPALQRDNDYMIQWQQRNARRSFFIALEDFTVPTFDRLAAWLGFPSCRFVRVAHSNARGGYMPDSSKDVSCASDR